MKIKQVTVFGGSGFIGQAIVRALAPEGYLVRVACRRIELAEKVKTAGDVGQITLMRANLRMPQSVAIAVAGSQAVINAAGIAFEHGRQRYKTVHGDGRPHDRRGGSRRRRRAAGPYLGHRRRQPELRRTAMSNPRSRRKTPSSPASRAPRSCGRAWCSAPTTCCSTAWPRSLRMAPFMPVVGNGRAKVQPVFVGDVGGRRGGGAGAARHGEKRVRAGRPTRLHLSRAGRPHPARDRPRQADHRRAGRPDEARRVLREFPAILGPHPADHPRPGRSSAPRQCRAAGRQDLASLGIAPTAAEVILPTYLDRFRVGGRYNQHAPA